MMHTFRFIIALLTVSIGVCQADEPVLKEGIWAGSIKLPGKDKTMARVRVSNETKPDTPAKTRVTMFVDETPLDFIDLNIRKNTLEFNIDTGTLKRCSMHKTEGGAYKGFCDALDSQDENGRIEISMRPPKESQISPATPTDQPANE